MDGMLRTAIVCLLLSHSHWLTHASLGEDAAASVSDCLTNSLESSLLCRGSRALRNAMHNLSKSDKPLVIMRGLEIVPSKDFANASANSNNRGDAPPEDDSFLERASRYLRTHELNIKFSDLLADESERYLTRDSERNGVKLSVAGVEEARKKDKGQGILLAMAMMSAKMMAVLGLGGIGALAMKALGVAMMALMMAGMVGLKSLAQQGHESSHSVSYVTAEGAHHHKRRRRSAAAAITTPTPALATTTAATTRARRHHPHSLAYSAWQRQPRSA